MIKNQLLAKTGDMLRVEKQKRFSLLRSAVIFLARVAATRSVQGLASSEPTLPSSEQSTGERVRPHEDERAEDDGQRDDPVAATHFDAGPERKCRAEGHQPSVPEREAD